MIPLWPLVVSPYCKYIVQLWGPSKRSGMVWKSLQLFENMVKPFVLSQNAMVQLAGSLHCELFSTASNTAWAWVALRSGPQSASTPSATSWICFKKNVGSEAQRIHNAYMLSYVRIDEKANLCWNWFVCTSQQHLNYSSFWNRICCGGVYICLCICWCFD